MITATLPAPCKSSAKDGPLVGEASACLAASVAFGTGSGSSG